MSSFELLTERWFAAAEQLALHKISDDGAHRTSRCRIARAAERTVLPDQGQLPAHPAPWSNRSKKRRRRDAGSKGISSAHPDDARSGEESEKWARA